MMKHQKLSLLLIAIVISTACQLLSSPEVQPTTAPDDISIPTTPAKPEPTSKASSQIELEQPIALFDDLESEYGQELLGWAQMAVADFNSSTNLNWSLSEVDAGNSVASAQTKVNELVSDNNVLAIVGLSRAGHHYHANL